MSNGLRKWVGVFLLSMAPVLVGVGETLAREFPENERFFGQPINLVSDVIVPSVIPPAIVLVVMGCLVVTILSTKHFRRWSVPVRISSVVAMSVVVVLVLWLGVLWAYWGVVSAYHGYWDLLFGPSIEVGLWALVGLIETVGIILAAVGFVKSIERNV